MTCFTGFDSRDLNDFKNDQRQKNCTQMTEVSPYVNCNNELNRDPIIFMKTIL